MTQPLPPVNEITVTIIANGDNENTPAEAIHHALEYARKAGFIEGWSDPVGPAQCAPSRKQIISAIEGRMVSFQGFSSPMLAGAIADEIIALSVTSTERAGVCGDYTDGA